ncbi:MAG: serine hydroxymethyltransferase [Betaproteobacteria bacterium]|jgi:glycine hydroxymethyltransferase|nr:serine hydroxymethyltransferase [Betaproteobacteria bacterium]MBK9784058.1 serine hydroxymethyltransferase [Candidatus Dechloromonas phosphorivorans]
MRYLSKFDGRLQRIQEITDLQWGILGGCVHLIASASYPFASVLRALAEPSMVLPAEGMPGARYLPGSTAMDLVEVEGEALVLGLFGNPRGYRATLQPHSGSQANQMAFNAVLKQDDVVLCMNPRDGGHISHTVLIGRRNRTLNFGLTAEGLPDYQQLRQLALEHRPRLIIVGGSALPRQIDFSLCGDIARESGAYLHADVSHTATFIAAGVHQSPFPHSDFVSFNTVKNLRGPNGGVLVYREQLQKAVHSSVFPTSQGGANENGMLGKFAALLEWNQRDIVAHAQGIVNQAHVMAAVFREEGLRLTTGGTDCHILLVELTERSGAEVERCLEDAGVLVNKNLIPNDKRSPSETSGIRVGTTNLAILGYEHGDTAELARWIARVLRGNLYSREVIDHLVGKYHRDNRWLTE